MSAHYKKDILLRMLLVAGLLLVFGLLVGWKILQIQYTEGEQWKALSRKLTYTYKEIEAIRGNIYAADGSLLATSVPRYEVRFDTRVVHRDTFNKYQKELATLLASRVGARSYPEYLQLLQNARRRGDAYLLLRRKATYLDIKEMRNWPIFRLGKYKGGFIVEEETVRTLPFGPLAARTIGFFKQDIGGVGIERAFNSALAGVNGKRLVQKISGGYRPLTDENAIDPVQGRDVYTSIVPQIQDISHDALRKALLTHGASHGCAVVMEVNSGRIVAISNLTRNDEGEYRERFNYSFGESYEPGSTFKLFSALALLEDGYYRPEDSIRIFGGKYDYFGQTMEDSEKDQPEYLSFQKSFEHSSNVGISRLVYEAYGKKPVAFLEHIHRLGLHQPLGISLPGEAKPFVKEYGKEGWYGTTLPWMSIGYEINLTPLHILTLYNAVANDGVMMKPTIVTGYGRTGKIEEVVEPEILKKSICGDEALKDLRGMLEGVVQRGTAQNLKNLGFPVAGKTGTALIADRNRGYSQKLYNASFAGYFPADAPQYSCIVVISRPSSGSYYGSSVAAPVFGEIARKVFAKEMRTPLMHEDQKALQPSWVVHAPNMSEFTEAIDWKERNDFDEDAYWVKVMPDSNGMKYQSVEMQGMLMPELKGMGLSDALYLLENRGLKVLVKGEGKIIGHWPAKGKQLSKGQNVILKLGQS